METKVMNAFYTLLWVLCYDDKRVTPNHSQYFADSLWLASLDAFGAIFFLGCLSMTFFS